MMSPEKFGKILKKLPKDKIELAKIELALKDDIKSSIQKHNKIIQKLESEIKLVKNIQKDYTASLDADVDSRKNLQAQIKKFKGLNSAQAKVADRGFKIAKELGVQITDISNFNQFDEMWLDTTNVFEEATQRIKSLD
tara:strand:- start:461 stop:874 length:414 start_codon:yes stop_codon:yes gene_type:complete